ncbi:polygalacturonase At1g48100-like [Punica granatum]|uniref:Uncharacterized protein n=2 Tax=Punica granatum TaxID=22663 RepID=A0A218WE94_PUNGR|nr:polygalacturonase At1g48100-like [Punica granatum]OWM70650.1 hypothetical protein CDL15_Pgr014323 [Punica granatum]PKI55203.1 hypothetical protein CRG98_024494 [Punica granatum]
MGSIDIVKVAIVLCLCVTVGTCHAREGKHLRYGKGGGRHHLSSEGLTSKSEKSHGHHKPPPKGHSPPKPPSPPAPTPAPLGSKNSTVFNVLDFGAKGDGHSDDSKAFLAAWAAACKVEASTVLIPSGSDFLVNPVSFTGPDCKPDIVFQLDGKIIAPTSSSAWRKGILHWIEFTKLSRMTITGKGIMDGRGSVWWNDVASYNLDQEDRTNSSLGLVVDAELDKMPNTKPTALQFYGSDQVTVTGITIQNSPQMHLTFDACTNLIVFGIQISSPGDSPNTDGIHLHNSQNVLIHDVDLACGDDCISIQTGSSSIYIHDVNCGPGHGISIGGLGKDNTQACVSNVTVRNAAISNAMTGVRIKTWQGASGSAQNIIFSNIQVSEVQTPIMIDQYYCDHAKCKNQTSAMAVSGITYGDIRGTYTVQPVRLACSDSVPCTGISLSSIQLKPVHSTHHLYNALCWNAHGEVKTDTNPPLIDCLSKGNPAKVPSKISSC